MKATFRIDHPNMLAEASAGDLFVPLGPALVECVCTLRCVDGAHGPQADLHGAARFDPDAPLGVVVIGCRVGAGEPEYYPPGYTTALSGAAPITFLRQIEPLALAPRPDATETPAPLFNDLDSLQRHIQRVERLTRAFRRAAPHNDMTRPELASSL